MSSLILTFVFDRRGRASREKAGSVELRLTLYRSQKFIATGVRVLPKYWKNGQVVGLEDASELNDSLMLLRKKVWKIANNLEDENKLSLDLLIERFNENRGPKLSFIDYCEQRSVIHSHNKADMTKKRYTLFVKWLKEYGDIVSFNDVTDTKIRKLDEYLHGKDIKECSRYSNYHRFMITFIRDAIIDGYLSKNPYDVLDIKKGDSNGLLRYLSPMEFAALKEAKMPTKSLEKVRDLFVFQTYTCLSFCDLETFDPNKMVQVGDIKVYSGKRKKTGKEYTFMMYDGALEILEKYNNKLPIISNVKYNLYLKAVAQNAGIEKNLTCHYARHTGATLLLNKGNLPIKSIAKVLGDTSREVEKTYAKLLDETVYSQMEKTQNLF